MSASFVSTALQNLSLFTTTDNQCFVKICGLNAFLSYRYSFVGRTEFCIRAILSNCESPLICESSCYRELELDPRSNLESIPVLAKHLIGPCRKFPQNTSEPTISYLARLRSRSTYRNIFLKFLLGLVFLSSFSHAACTNTGLFHSYRFVFD